MGRDRNSWAFDIHHIIPREAYSVPQTAAALEAAGFPAEARGNKIALFWNPGTAAEVRSQITSGNTFFLGAGFGSSVQRVRRLGLLCVTMLALVSCNDDRESFIDLPAIRADVGSGTVAGSARNYLRNDVAFICSLGPYTWPSHVKNIADIRMVEKVDIFPVSDGVGYFLYFNEARVPIGKDKFNLSAGAVRWQHWKEGEDDSFCAQPQDATIIASLDADALYVGLMPIHGTLQRREP